MTEIDEIYVLRECGSISLIDNKTGYLIEIPHKCANNDTGLVEADSYYDEWMEDKHDKDIYLEYWEENAICALEKYRKLLNIPAIQALPRLNRNHKKMRT